MVQNIYNSNNNALNYNEKKDNLAIRIEANKRFSNFNLEDWLREYLPFQYGDKIIDIGCGNGNLFLSYAQKLKSNGLIVGLDQSKDLLFEAKKSDFVTPHILLLWNMNSQIPFMDESFDHAISTFAIYYANDIPALIRDIARVLKPGGEVIFIGPADNNAKELYDFNTIIFNIDKSRKAIQRANRIKQICYPAARDVLDDVLLSRISSKLIFPSREEFIKYYTATLLFEESLAESGLNPKAEKIFSAHIPSLEISKEMIFLRGRKR